MAVSSGSIARGSSGAAVTGFLGVLGWYLFQPGYGWLRFVLFGALAALAVLCSIGVWYRRPRVTAGGITGLLVLTVSVAGTLWLFILPVIIVLGAAALVTSNRAQTTPSQSDRPT
jgi:hypothetical protein